MKCERCLAHCDNDYHQSKSMNDPVAPWSPAIGSSEFSSSHWDGYVGGGRSQDLGIVDRIKRRIRTMLLTISTLSSLYTMLQFIYSTFIHIACTHSCHSFIHITRCLFQSWQEGAALLLLLLILPAAGEPDNLSTTKISMTISAWYLTITRIVKTTIHNPRMRLFGDHQGKQWGSSHQQIPSRQHLENKSWQLN